MKIPRLVLMYLMYILQLTANTVAWAIGLAQRALGFARRMIMIHAYYPVCVARRKLNGEPTWKEIDWIIGIPPPKEIMDKMQRDADALFAEKVASGKCPLCESDVDPDILKKKIPPMPMVM